MRKQIKTTEAIFPMPVLMVATYNEDESINVMNAAEYSTSDGRTLEGVEIDISHYKNKDKLIHDVINYVEDHGGKCN